MTTRATVFGATLTPRIGLPLMLLVACAYALLALLGTAGLERALGGHAAVELLHFRSDPRTISLQEGDEAMLSLPRLGQIAAPAAAVAAASSDPATGLLSPPAQPQGVALFAHWLGLAVTWLAAPVESGVLPWPDAPTRSATLTRWYRSVVLHL